MITKPRGTEDLYGTRSREMMALSTIFRNLMDIYNYDEITTPVFEALDLFKRGVGEDTDVVSKEMFVFNDRKDRQFALRPEGTASTVRMIIENKLYTPENLPLKLFYIESMFRYERPQAGRQRQFNQFGVEVYGASGWEIDCEVIALGVNCLNQIGLKSTVCHLNYLVSGSARKKYIADLIAYFATKSLCNDCQQCMTKNPLRVLDCKTDSAKHSDVIDMKDYLSETEKNHFTAIQTGLKNLGIEVVLDKLLVRGLDYYTGVVFEIKSTNEKQGAQSTLIGGGRYDNLVADLGGSALPAVGFALGMERILIALANENIVLANEKALDCFIVGLTEKAQHLSLILSTMLRASGITCDINHMNKNLKASFKLAERLHASHIMIIGENELKEKQVVIKDQATKTEVKVPFDHVVAYFESEGN